MIPAEIRRRLNIKEGMKLYVKERDDEIVLKVATPANFARIAGVVLPTKGKLSRMLIKERRRPAS